MHASLYLAALAVGAFARLRLRRLGRDGGRPADPARGAGRDGRRYGDPLVLAAAASDASVGLLDLAPGLFVFGLGMGMIFVPLFSIIMGEIDDHEVGSASGLLESLQQLGASLGVAVLGTVFFDTPRPGAGRPPAPRSSAGRHLAAAENTLLMVLVVLALAWAVGWLLPRKAREMH